MTFLQKKIDAQNVESKNANVISHDRVIFVKKIKSNVKIKFLRNKMFQSKTNVIFVSTKIVDTMTKFHAKHASN